MTSTVFHRDEYKIKPIQNFPTPRTRKQLNLFQAVLIIIKFSETIQPLLPLTSKKVKFNWTPSDDETILNIKHLSLNTQILHYPGPKQSQPFFLETDTLSFAIGGHLYQLTPREANVSQLFSQDCQNQQNNGLYTSQSTNNKTICMHLYLSHHNNCSSRSRNGLIDGNLYDALVRFTSCRGLCSDLYSDCGTYFMDFKLKHVIHTLKKDQNVKVPRYASEHNIKFYFLPPH